MNSITPSIFPRSAPFPQTIDIRESSNRHIADTVRHLMNRQMPTSPSSGVIPIGMAYHASQTGEIQFLALADTAMVFLVCFDKKSHIPDKKFADLLSAGGEKLDETLPRLCLVGFSMARTAVYVSQAMQLSVKGVDLCTIHSPDTWSPKSPAETVLQLESNADKWKVLSLWLGDEQSARADVCTQAWLAACVGSKCQEKLENSLKVDTRFINVLERDCLAQLVAQSDLLDSHKPKEVPNDFSKAAVNKDGKLELLNARFKTRVRRSDCTQVIMTGSDGREYVGNAQGSKGKTTTIKIQGNQRGFASGLQSVRVVGREQPTNSERARDELIHLVLTGGKDLRRSPFIRALWFPKWKETNINRQIHVVDSEIAETLISKNELNESQRGVVYGMVCDTRVVVAHGPPGTGKTTTIGAASSIWASLSCPVWIVTHSNVAVKNIAETLCKKGVDFKLLVSKEFYDEWHEHLYAEVERNLIRSDELPKDSHGMERLLGGSRIILCTLSMLSNDMLHTNGTFDIVPLERLIIDEASQINLFEFLHIFVKFQETLGKVCFFGDPMQLPPFGKDNVPSVKTIFDLPHISNSDRDFFLDTQYRMPVAIGNFISSAVYSGRLQSEHLIKHDNCVAFIDVAPPRGEEEKVGFSWRNDGEIQAILHLVRYYYRRKNFCILTPYDSQRAAIQKALKGENLPWESVFNVDSFQGNEADYVLISVVRSSGPGFLSSLNRMNVLLTRCKKAMVFVTSRSFIRFGGSQTLVGKIAAYWSSKQRQGSSPWIDWRLVAGGFADLPDALGPHRLKTNPVRHYNVHADAQHSILTPRVPALYQSPSGGFDVGALFQRKSLWHIESVWNRTDSPDVVARERVPPSNADYSRVAYADSLASALPPPSVSEAQTWGPVEYRSVLSGPSLVIPSSSVDPCMASINEQAWAEVPSNRANRPSGRSLGRPVSSAVPPKAKYHSYAARSFEVLGRATHK